MLMTVDRCAAVLAADAVGMLSGLCVRQQRGLAIEPAEQRLEAVRAGDLRLLLCVQCFISIIRRLNVVISCVQLVGGHAVQLTHDGQRVDHRLHSGYSRVRIVPGVFILAALGRIRFAVLSATGVRGTGILLATLCAVLFLIRSSLFGYGGRNFLLLLLLHDGAALRRILRRSHGCGQERQAQSQRHECTQ